MGGVLRTYMLVSVKFVELGVTHNTGDVFLKSYHFLNDFQGRRGLWQAASLSETCIGREDLVTLFLRVLLV